MNADAFLLELDTFKAEHHQFENEERHASEPYAGGFRLAAQDPGHYGCETGSVASANGNRE